MHAGFRDQLASRKTPVFTVLLQGYNLPARITRTGNFSAILAWAHEQRCCHFSVHIQNPRGQNLSLLAGTTAVTAPEDNLQSLAR